MKIFLVTIALLFIANNSYAININNALKDIGKDSSKQINANLDKKIDKVVAKFENEIDDYKKQLDGEVSKVKSQIKEAENAVNKLKEIKAKAGYYINLVKIILAILSSGILLLIFAMWRIWRNIVNMKKIIRNVTNYDDIEARLKKVEKAVGTI